MPTASRFQIDFSRGGYVASDTVIRPFATKCKAGDRVYLTRKEDIPAGACKKTLADIVFTVDVSGRRVKDANKRRRQTMQFCVRSDGTGWHLMDDPNYRQFDDGCTFETDVEIDESGAVMVFVSVPGDGGEDIELTYTMRAEKLPAVGSLFDE